MTGPEHYQAAEGLVITAGGVMDFEHGFYSNMSKEERIQRRIALAAEAQVHATLALAAAIGLGSDQYRNDSAMWRHVAMTPFEQALPDEKNEGRS